MFNDCVNKINCMSSNIYELLMMSVGNIKCMIYFISYHTTVKTYQTGVL